MKNYKQQIKEYKEGWLDLFRYLCSMEQILREMIEKMVGRKMVVPRDFAWLSEKVEERTQHHDALEHSLE